MVSQGESMPVMAGSTAAADRHGVPLEQELRAYLYPGSEAAGKESKTRPGLGFCNLKGCPQ